MKYTTQQYIDLGNFAKEYDHSKTINEISEYFNYIYNKDEMDYIGLQLQICVKQSRPMYLHGYLLTSALEHYIKNNSIKELTILETGTARGFSALVMAKILEMNNIKGIIHTIDILSHNTPIFDNCLKASKLNKNISRQECLEEWQNVVEKYITFHSGDTRIILNNLNFSRINFAFLDAQHNYENVKQELNFVKDRQLKGDIIVCDDYTITQYPSICKAIDEFLVKKLYDYKIFYGDDGTKKRGYVYMIKI